MGEGAELQPKGNAAFVNNLRDRIDNYFKILQRNVRDIVPKSVGYFLVQKSQDRLTKDLLMRINTNQHVLTLPGESSSVAERR